MATPRPQPASAPAPDRHEVFALADRMFHAIEDGDLDALVDCYGPGFVAWTNVGGEQDLDATLGILRWLTRRLADRRYDVQRRELLPDGLVPEHVLRGTAPDGTTVAVPACVLVTVADGRITRINEYLDPAGVAALMGGT